MDSSNSIWEIIFDCPRMESLQYRYFSALTMEEREFVLIRMEGVFQKSLTLPTISSHVQQQEQKKDAWNKHCHHQFFPACRV